MHVHEWPQTVPELALAMAAGVLKRMRNHASYACMAELGENGGIYGDFLTGYCADSSARLFT